MSSSAVCSGIPWREVRNTTGNVAELTHDREGRLDQVSVRWDGSPGLIEVSIGGDLVWSGPVTGIASAAIMAPWDGWPIWRGSTVEVSLPGPGQAVISGRIDR